MRKEDITQVTEIDREAFPGQWPPPNYQHELRNRLAHYIVVCDEERTANNPEVKASSDRGSVGLTAKLRQLFNRNSFFGDKVSSSTRDYIVGFAGFWVMADEVHLISIAVRETYRRQGLGELLLISVINLAVELEARMATLEVRVSNTDAQNLYTKYGFIQTNVRRGYYIDNREDGIQMSVQDITSVVFQTQFQELKHSHSTKCGMALYQVVR
jgi:ribosomal-protein-alanine N-acetyltransferase